jgi:hypothetical protein
MLPPETWGRFEAYACEALPIESVQLHGTRQIQESVGQYLVAIENSGAEAEDE